MKIRSKMPASNDKKPISPETKALLIIETTQSMREVVGLVDQARKSIRFIDQVIEVSSTTQQKNISIQAQNDELHHLRRLGEYTLIVGLIHLDMTSAIRTYLNGTEPYDTLYASKQLLITINEGYKQIYNYITDVEVSKFNRKQKKIDCVKGIGRLIKVQLPDFLPDYQRIINDLNLDVVDSVQNDHKRKQSYWVKDIGRLIKAELPDLLPDYQSITDALNLYDDQELKEMTNPRNLAIHYDKNASKVYDMIIALDIESLARKAIPFIAILNDMVHFSFQTLRKYDEIIKAKAEKAEAFHLNKLEDLKAKHPNAIELLSEVQAWVKNFGK